MISVDPQPVFFWERFSSALDDRSEDIFADRLHAFNMLKWTVRLNGIDAAEFQDRTSGAAQNAFTTSLGYSLRDTIADSPLMVWLEKQQGFLGTLLRDSIDSVEEESVSPLDGSYGLVERSWWRKLRDSRALHYGIRPFRTSPYVFSSFALRDHGEVFFLGHVRYYYDRFADHRFEIATSIPLAYGFAIGVGTSYRFGKHDNQGQIGLKVSKDLKSGGVVHVGFELRRAPTLLAGVTFPW